MGNRASRCEIGSLSAAIDRAGREAGPETPRRIRALIRMGRVMIRAWHVLDSLDVAIDRVSSSVMMGRTFRRSVIQGCACAALGAFQVAVVGGSALAAGTGLALIWCGAAWIGMAWRAAVLSRGGNTTFAGTLLVYFPVMMVVICLLAGIEYTWFS